MDIIKKIEEADYCCEERSEGTMCLVALEDENGRIK